MQKIDVRGLGPHEYAVRVTEGRDTTDHRVVVTDQILDDLALDLDPADPSDRDTETDLVRESIAFLLDRITANDLDPEVDLEEISVEYADYLEELSVRLGLD
jgi:hypothetical protein